jgi:two-component system OmpR family sensor kinase
VTLRGRLVVALAAVGVAIVVAGVVVVTTQRHYLIDQVDRELQTSSVSAGRLAGGPGPGGGPPPSSSSSSVPSELFELYVARVSSKGSVLDVLVPGQAKFGSPDLTGRDLSALADSSSPTTVSAKGAGGSYRVLVRPTFSGYVVSALPLDRVDSATTRLVVVMGVGGAVILGVLALLGWWVVRLGLRPIRQMTEAADAIAQGHLDRRVEHPPPTTEAGRLGRAFNVMLDERQAAEEQLRRFVSDASHELRTPLTSIRGYTELYRRGGLADDGALDDAMRRVGQEAHRMTDIVEDLLLLARLDEGRPLERSPVDVTQILRDAVSDAAAVEPERPITAEVADGVVAAGDENRLRQVVGALVGNALVHTDGTVPIVVRGRLDGPACVIEVDDEGLGMPTELAGRAFDRFVRGDDTRSRRRGGSGLGLAIVKSVVEAHAGHVTLETAPGRGTCVRVVLPVPARDSQEVPGQL